MWLVRLAIISVSMLSSWGSAFADSSVLDVFEKAAGIPVPFSMGHVRFFHGFGDEGRTHLLILSKNELSDLDGAHIFKIQTNEDGRISNVQIINTAEMAREIAPTFSSAGSFMTKVKIAAGGVARVIEAPEADIPFDFELIVEELSRKSSGDFAQSESLILAAGEQIEAARETKKAWGDGLHILKERSLIPLYVMGGVSACVWIAKALGAL